MVWSHASLPAKVDLQDTAISAYVLNMSVAHFYVSCPNGEDSHWKDISQDSGTRMTDIARFSVVKVLSAGNINFIQDYESWRHNFSVVA